jgi:outer membrane protein, multidrug efflux system
MVESCTVVGPNYHKPSVNNLTTSWNESTPEENQPDSVNLCEWWKQLNDCSLNRLIDCARENNLNIKQAFYRIRQSRAELAVSLGERYPSLILDGSSAYQHWNVDTGVSTAKEFPLPTALYLGSISASWEIDFFGRIKRTIESSCAEWQGSVYQYHDILIILYAEVATAYIEYQALIERLDYAEKNGEIQKKTVELTEVRYKEGYSPKTDVVRAKSNYFNTLSQIPPIKNSIKEVKHRLAVLLGQQAGTLDDCLLNSEGVPKLPNNIAVGIPCDLIRQRPDIREAERDLASKTAKIGIQAAEFYPKISLTGSFTGIGTPLTDNHHLNLQIFGLGPALSWDVFNGGRTQNRVCAAYFEAKQSFYQYHQNILEATQEVEDALSALNQELSRNESLKQAVVATEEAVELIKISYLEGLLNFQPLLDIERTLFILQDQLSESNGLIIKSYIALNKALGGGW